MKVTPAKRMLKRAARAKLMVSSANTSCRAVAWSAAGLSSKPGSAGCRAAALVALRHLQEVGGRPRRFHWWQNEPEGDSAAARLRRAAVVL